MQRSSAAFFFCLLVLVAQKSYAQDATLETTGTLGGFPPEVWGASSDGSVVVGQGENGLGQYQAYYWDGTIQQLSLGGTEGIAYTASADGGVVIGYSENAFGEYHAFAWDGVMHELSLGGTGGEAYAVSADGSVVAGESENALGETQAFYWDGVMHELSLGGTSGVAIDVSNDGGVVVGRSRNALGQLQAFAWDGAMHELSLGGTSGSASAVSYDGSVVVGQSRNALGQQQAFYWDGVMHELSLGGGFGYATAVSADGSIVIGYSQNVALDQQAFYWDGAIHELSLGGTGGRSLAVSADGGVIVGYSQDNLGDFRTFLWDPVNGMRTIEDVLTGAGVDLTGWDLSYTFNGHYISADGLRIIGTADYLGDDVPYIMTLAGLITPEELVQSLAPVAVPALQSQASMQNSVGQSLWIARNASGYFPRASVRQNDDHKNSLDALVSLDPKVLQDIAPAAGGDDSVRARSAKRKSFYATGSLGAGQNNNFGSFNGSGSTGVLVEVTPYVTAGLGVIGSHNREETHLDGQSRTTAYGASALLSYEPASAARIYAAFSVAALDVSTDRHYMNGGGVDGSSGDTEGYGVGGAIKAGYEFELYETVRVMPYIEFDASHAALDGYTETGGGFPATVDDQSETYLASRLGAEVTHVLSDDFTMRGRAAWGHRYSDGGAVTATAATITQSIPGDAGDRDWLEAGIGINYDVTEQATFSADLSGRAGKTAEPAINVMTGFVWKWN